jgi:hypothetical protein
LKNARRKSYILRLEAEKKRSGDTTTTIATYVLVIKYKRVMNNTEEKEYNTGHSVGGAPGVSIVILKTNPNERKSITKRYPDGRTLTLLVIDDRLVEKSLTFHWEWDYELIREEKERGKSVSFKFWKKGELELGLSYFGNYLFGKMFTLDYTEILTPNLVAYSWRDELLYDIAFPMVDVKKVRLEDGFSSTEKENPFMKELMHDMVVDALTKSDNEKIQNSCVEEEKEPCLFCGCGESQCVWVSHRDAVIANDENEHGHTFAIVNKTRRKIAFRYMFRVINGGPGQKGIRKRQPECVENGIRALFPDTEYMGFKEE